MTRSNLDRYCDENSVYFVTAIEAKTGIRRDLWGGRSLRNAIRHQNVVLPEKYREIYRDYELEEKAV